MRNSHSAAAGVPTRNPSRPVITIQHLSKRFVTPARFAFARGARAGNVSTVHAVRDVNLHAPPGCITGLLGPNGAGKTTTLRMLAGLITPDAGSIEVDGVDVRSDPHAALEHMGVLSDARGLYPRLSARENIAYYGMLRGMSRDAADARAESLARTLEMRSLLDRRTEGFSQGERLKTALARALVHDPANVVLDEPTNGLDVMATRALRDVLRWLGSPEGGAKTIVFSTHIMQEVQNLCDKVIVVAQGRSVAEGTVRELLERTGESDFEDAFVRLAYADTPADAPADATAAQEAP